jgi:hypothetical protein
VAIFGVQGWRWDWVREVHALVFALDADPAGQQQWRQLARQAALGGHHVAGQQGSTLIRWLDRYAEAHATAVTQMTVRDFPPWVVGQIDEEVEGDTATTTNVAMVVTLMARLGAAHGLRGVPLAMADAVTLTQALVLEKALVTLQTEARMGAEAGDVPQPGPTSPLGAALQG